MHTKIPYNAEGRILSYHAIDSSAGHLDVDVHTNPSVVSGINGNSSAYLVVDGVLTKDGVAVTINPPCEDCVTLDSVATASTVEELRKVVQLLIDKPGFRRG